MWEAYLKGPMKMPLRDFKTVDCEALLRQIVRKRNLGVRTIGHIKHLLSGIFRYAIRTGFLNGANPVRDAVLPKAKAPSETHAYSLDEVLKMIELLPEPARTIVAVAGFTGLRRGELRGLEIGDYTAGVLPSIQLRTSGPSCLTAVACYIDGNATPVATATSGAIDQWVNVSMGAHKVQCNGWAAEVDARQIGRAHV